LKKYLFYFKIQLHKKSSTEEYSLQVDNFNSVQRQSIEVTIPNACRTLQDIHAMNSTTWQELLNRILKIETNNTEKEQGQYYYLFI